MVDFINLSKLGREESESNETVSGLVPHKGYLKAKVRNVNNRPHDYCRNRVSRFGSNR